MKHQQCSQWLCHLPNDPVLYPNQVKPQSTETWLSFVVIMVTFPSFTLKKLEQKLECWLLMTKLVKFGTLKMGHSFLFHIKCSFSFLDLWTMTTINKLVIGDVLKWRKADPDFGGFLRLRVVHPWVYNILDKENGSSKKTGQTMALEAKSSRFFCPELRKK